jgi:hypothetical protein
VTLRSSDLAPVTTGGSPQEQQRILRWTRKKEASKPPRDSGEAKSGGYQGGRRVLLVGREKDGWKSGSAEV